MALEQVPVACQDWAGRLSRGRGAVHGPDHRSGSAGVRGVHHCCEPHIRLECAIDLLLRAVLRGRSDAQGQS